MKLFKLSKHLTVDVVEMTETKMEFLGSYPDVATAMSMFPDAVGWFIPGIPVNDDGESFL